MSGSLHIQSQRTRNPDGDYTGEPDLENDDDIDSLPRQNRRREDEDDSQFAEEEVEDDFDQQLKEFLRDVQWILLSFAIPGFARWLGRRFSLWAWTSYVQWYYQPRVIEERDTREHDGKRRR